MNQKSTSYARFGRELRKSGYGLESALCLLVAPTVATNLWQGASGGHARALLARFCDATYELSDAVLSQNSNYSWVNVRNVEWSASLTVSAALSSSDPNDANTPATGAPTISGV